MKTVATLLALLASLSAGQCEPEDIDGDGYTWGDCAPSDISVHPGALEICNSVDDDCDGHTDDVDADGDGWSKCYRGPLPSDCNDSDPQIHPGAPDVCNDFNDDCDGAVDEDCAP